jgi:hypothetical protein
VAGHVRFELRNVGANYLFERSHEFPGIKPNSGHRDYSRLSCGGGETQLGLVPGSQPGFLRGRSVIEAHRRSGGGQLSNTIAHFALDFSRQESVCGGHGQRA